jgi:hypothetical protein
MILPWMALAGYMMISALLIGFATQRFLSF